MRHTDPWLQRSSSTRQWPNAFSRGHLGGSLELLLDPELMCRFPRRLLRRTRDDGPPRSPRPHGPELASEGAWQHGRGPLALTVHSARASATSPWPPGGSRRRPSNPRRRSLRLGPRAPRWSSLNFAPPPWPSSEFPREPRTPTKQPLSIRREPLQTNHDKRTRQEARHLCLEPLPA